MATTADCTQQPRKSTELRKEFTFNMSQAKHARSDTCGAPSNMLPESWLEKSVSTMTLIYIHMYCVPWRRKNAPNVTIHAQEVYMGMCLLATNLILSPEFHFRYEKVPLICRRLLMPIGDDHGNVKGYFIPLTDFGKASKMTLDGAMHVRIFRPDLVIIMFQFLEAATRKMVTCNAMVNAQNGMNTWQTIRRLNRLFCGQRLVSSYDAKPPSGDFTMPVLCSLPYVQKRLKTQLPSQLRRTMAERYLTTHIPRCRTSADISDCIAELARIMESNSRNIILNYTNFVLNSRICLKTPIEKEEGVLKDGLMDFIATRARPNMFYQFEHVMGRMQEAFPGIGKKDIERLSLAYQSSRKSQQEWEMEFSDHIQALDDLCTNTTTTTTSSSSSSSTETCDLLKRAKELIECWKTWME